MDEVSSGGVNPLFYAEKSRGFGAADIASTSDQQCCDYFAAFCSQKVKGPAGGWGVHGFYANPARIKTCQPLCLWETQAFATAKKHQLSPPICEAFKLFGAK